MRAALVLMAVAGLVGAALLPSHALGGGAAPGFAGGGPWFNTGGRPLSLNALRGRVVAVDIWTAGCINCLNTLPYVKQWYAKYRGQGFIVVGVHSPEFDHERAPQYVRDAISRLGIAYPVVLDNEFKIWRAYRNNYWPTIYVIDKKGQIRYSHIGEGDYTETESAIARLLREPAR